MGSQLERALLFDPVRIRPGQRGRALTVIVTRWIPCNRYTGSRHNDDIFAPPSMRSCLS